MRFKIYHYYWDLTYLWISRSMIPKLMNFCIRLSLDVNLSSCWGRTVEDIMGSDLWWIDGTVTHSWWASTLANRSNARHRSNIRAPPTPPPPRCKYPKCGNLCGQRSRKRFIASWGLRMSHICPCTPCPSPQGYRSKVESRHFAHHWWSWSQTKRSLGVSPFHEPDWFGQQSCRDPAGNLLKKIINKQPWRLFLSQHGHLSFVPLIVINKMAVCFSKWT